MLIENIVGKEENAGYLSSWGPVWLSDKVFHSKSRGSVFGPY